MTDLIDRFSNEAQSLGLWKINAARFANALVLYSHGLATALQIAESFNLSGDEIAQATKVKDVVDAKGTLNEKLVYAQKVGAVMQRVADPHDTIFHTGSGVNKGDVKTALEIT